MMTLIRPQFSVRSFMLLVTLTAIGLGWYVHRIEKRKRAITAIRALGATVVFERQPSSGHTWWSRTTAGMFGNESVSNVTLVSFQNRRVADDDLSYLTELAELLRLDLFSTSVTDQGLRDVSRISNLESLDIINAPITDAGVVYLRDLTHLRRLNLCHTRVTGRTLDRIGGSIGLLELHLAETPVGNDGVRYIVAHRGLQILNLNGTRIDDACVSELASLAQLSHLHMHNTKLTPAAIQELARRLPGCRIIGPN